MLSASAVLALAGCAAPAQPKVAVTPARASITFLNVTPYQWRVELTPVGAGATADREAARVVGPFERLSVVGAVGSNRCRFEVLGPVPPGIPPREVVVDLQAGEPYDWVLATRGYEAPAVPAE